MITLRRELATALAWATIAALVVATAGVAVAAATDRGDLAATAVTLFGLGFGALALLQGIRRWRRRAGDPLRMATTLARSSGGLPPSVRREVLGAVEVLWTLEGRHVSGPGRVDSIELAAAEVERVDERVRAYLDVDPLPPPDRRLLVGMAIALALAGGVASTGPGQVGLALLLEGRDGRPPPPPEPLWSSLTLQIEYPPHTGRSPRQVQNPSGALRVPAGTRIVAEVVPRAEDDALKITLVEDSSDAVGGSPRTVDLEPNEGGALTGALVLRGPTTWSITGADHRSSPTWIVEIEPDNPPEVELRPLPRTDREPSEIDTVDVRFKARDDFGLRSAALAFEGPDGEIVRLDVGPPPPGARTWSHRYAWDLGQLALADRPSVEYWIEVRDNDPGLGLAPLPDPPGKVTRSARMRLDVRDRESEHNQNIAGLQEIRDAAVDHLAHRMAAPVTHGDLATARGLFAEGASLLSLLATMIDRLSVDTLAKERDAAAVTAIHRRLHAVYRDEAAIHERIPAAAEAAEAAILARLATINQRQISQLEDEIIRLDDLVDHQIVDRIEQLVARLQASQHKLLELLERLKAGDTSVQPAIEQLQQRIREDLRRISEARAQLKKEVDGEFLNLDAFEALQARMEHEDVMERLRQGNVDGAIERAKALLDEIRELRDTVQDRLASAPAERMSPQERARMRLLRELSRLQDEERGVQSATQSIYQEWRASVAERELEERDAEAIAKEARALRKRIEGINDARLGRDARSALEDALEQLDRLEGTRGALATRESVEAIHDAIRRASAGARSGEREASQLERARADAARMLAHAREHLPNAEESVGDAAIERLQGLSERQAGLQGRAKALLEESDAEQLPDAGKAALRGAASSMEKSTTGLQERVTSGALRDEGEALQQIQRAIDSLRSSSPPPSGASGPASTESERDRTLRDEVMEAMRERPPDGFSESVQHYYEELLR